MIQEYISSKNRGQALSFDFLIICAIFVIIVTILLIQVGYNISELNEFRSKNEMSDEAHRLSEVFFDEGYPKNWNTTNVKIIGLATGGRIDWKKLNNLKNLGYQKSLILLGLKNDYNITIFKGNATIYSFGKSIENATSLVKIDRIGVLNSSIVYVRVMIFNYE